MNNPSRILLVEDNPDDEALLMRQIKNAKLDPHIKAIHDGGKALEYLLKSPAKNEQPAAIFLDLKLPTLSGLDLLRAIRKDTRLQEIPVIVMTSSNSPEDLEACRQLGVFAYVAKPLTFSSFAKAFSDTFHTIRESKRSRMTAESPEQP